jgi:hypothetical protein
MGIAVVDPDVVRCVLHLRELSWRRGVYRRPFEECVTPAELIVDAAMGR